MASAHFLIKHFCSLLQVCNRCRIGLSSSLHLTFQNEKREEGKGDRDNTIYYFRLRESALQNSFLVEESLLERDKCSILFEQFAHVVARLLF